MKVIFMGTPDISVGVLEAILAAGHEVTAVVSQPDKPKGRGHALQPTPVKAAAEKHGLTVYQPAKVRDEEFLQTLSEIEADIIVVIAFGQIIPKQVLEMKKYGCINVHASLLPKYRGAAPIQWAVLNGEKESGVTIMQMDEGLDTGDMLLKEVVPLDPKETSGSLFEKISHAGAKACVEALVQIEAGTITGEKQGESPTAYACMLKKEMGQMDFTKSAVELERLIRGLNPWPSAYTKLNGKTLKIWAADVLPPVEAPCGSVVDVTKNSLEIATGDGVLSVTELQLEGKKRMSTEDFLRGYSVARGIRLGE